MPQQCREGWVEPSPALGRFLSKEDLGAGLECPLSQGPLPLQLVWASTFLWLECSTSFSTWGARKGEWWPALHVLGHLLVLTVIHRWRESRWCSAQVHVWLGEIPHCFWTSRVSSSPSKWRQKPCFGLVQRIKWDNPNKNLIFYCDPHLTDKEIMAHRG